MSLLDRGLVKPAMSAAVGAFAITHQLGDKVGSQGVTFSLGGTSVDVPLWAAGAGMGAAGSYLADLVHAATHGKHHKNNGLDDFSSLLTVGLSNAAVWFAVPSIFGGGAFENIQELAVAGVASELIARAVWERYLSQAVSHMF